MQNIRHGMGVQLESCDQQPVSDICTERNGYRETFVYALSSTQISNKNNQKMSLTLIFRHQFSSKILQPHGLPSGFLCYLSLGKQATSAKHTCYLSTIMTHVQGNIENMSDDLILPGRDVKVSGKYWGLLLKRWTRSGSKLRRSLRRDRCGYWCWFG